jgi:hypothetical protein
MEHVNRHYHLRRKRETMNKLCRTTVAVLMLGALPAFGLINPKFTPTDLVRSSSQVLLLNISAPKDNVVAAEVVEVLRGSAPAARHRRSPSNTMVGHIEL